MEKSIHVHFARGFSPRFGRSDERYQELHR
jgi:hypothetical protein